MIPRLKLCSTNTIECINDIIPVNHFALIFEIGLMDLGKHIQCFPLETHFKKIK